MPVNWLGLRLAIFLRRLVTHAAPRRARLDVERWGLAMRLHPLDNGCEKNLLFTPQMYEPAKLAAVLETEIDRVRAARRPLACFVDIGANVRACSRCSLRRKAGPAARIIAIEPEPGNFARLDVQHRQRCQLPDRAGRRPRLAISAGEVAIAPQPARPRRRHGCRSRVSGSGGYRACSVEAAPRRCCARKTSPPSMH